MITSLIKQATINLQPEVEQTEDWFGLGDPIAYEDDEDEDEDCDDYEDIEVEDGDEWEECDCEDSTEASLETTVFELGYNDSLQTINDSEVLMDFMDEVIDDLGRVVPVLFYSVKLSKLDFIDFDVHENEEIFVTVDLNALERYLDSYI